jgi:hypothetical protein
LWKLWLLLSPRRLIKKRLCGRISYAAEFSSLRGSMMGRTLRKIRTTRKMKKVIKEVYNLLKKRLKLRKILA